jgi:hypothetical protein
VKDILEEYNIQTSFSQKKNYIFHDDVEEKIYHTLMLEPCNIDELGKKMQIDILGKGV